MNFKKYIAELKRRNVFKAGIAYVIVAWLIAQVASLVLPTFEAPSYVLKTLLFLLIMGFPINLIFSWIYDVTPEGIRKTENVDLKTFKSPQKDSRLNKVIIASIFFVIILLLYNQFLNTSNNKEGKIEVSETSEANENSIAVLAFSDMSPQKDQEYLSDGISIELHYLLGKISELKVESRTSSFSYKATKKTAEQIGKELGVSHVLEGSVRKNANKFRIDTQLTKVEDGTLLWSETYDHNFEDILTIESEIAKKVLVAIKAKLSLSDKKLLHEKRTTSAAAYEFYLKGIFEYRTYAKPHSAIEFFKSAIALDSNYAKAYAGLARAYISLASVIVSELNSGEAFSIAKPLLDKALDIDPELEEAHVGNGFYFLYNNWDFEEAEREYKKAIVNDNPDALAIYADFLNFTRRHTEALIISERLNETNPYYPNTRMLLSLYYVGEYEKAMEFFESRKTFFQGNYFATDSYGFLLLNTGQYDKAIQILQKAIDIQNKRTPRMLGWMGAAYARKGDQEQSLLLLEELKKMKAQSSAGSPSFFIAVIYSASNDKSSALKWLQNAFDDHEQEIPWLNSEPQFYHLHDEPTFQKLLHKVGFPK